MRVARSEPYLLLQLKMQGLGFRVWGLGFKVFGLGSTVYLSYVTVCIPGTSVQVLHNSLCQTPRYPTTKYLDLLRLNPYKHMHVPETCVQIQ